MCVAEMGVECSTSRSVKQIFEYLRCNRFAFFGEETAMFVNGEVQGYTIPPIGCPQPKVVDNNPKETVTAVLAGVATQSKSK